MEILIEENEGKGRAYFEDLAEMTFIKEGKESIIIDHTLVDEKLRGQGAARKLLDAVVNYARERNLKIIPVCSYAKSIFEKDESIRDVLN